MKQFVIILVILWPWLSVEAQTGGIGIGTSEVEKEALLQIGTQQTDTKGLLIPSNTSSGIEVITSPPNGLLMYSTDEHRFVYAKNGIWKYLNPWDTNELNGESNYIATPYPVTISNTLTASGAAYSGKVTAASFAGNGVVPIGGIIMWNGSVNDIPPSFKLCDGEDGRPDLAGKFIMAGSSAGSGGTNTLSTTEIVYTPRERYVSGTPDCSEYEYLYSGQVIMDACGGSGTRTFTNVPANSCADAGIKSHNCSVSASCHTTSPNPKYYMNNDACKTDAAVAEIVTTTDNRPEYYVLAFIIRVE